ncbi:general secretion pathway protein GspM [Geobacter sp. DSM 9736]|uniref:general secretion pathway protein GspM n=1 Tax=Geobacter sp. DSM 9736 TaxID=1277350 RepID=UPI000B50E688|nr:general secretion pathway protein GspM [Geobacter sp. DSM 9736]SNB47412.1 general secretion pathway protein M [Geobacter sp. DSM 9736]
MKYAAYLQEQYRNMDPQTRLRIGIGIAIVLIAALLLSSINAGITTLKRKRASREAAVVEMLQLKARYREASMGAQKLANRMASVRPEDSPAKVVEETGIKGKNLQIRPLRGEQGSGFVEDAAEVKMDGLSANETVNLLFKLEKGAKPVVIKRALLKTRFDNPALFDVTLTVALLKPAPQGQR